MRATVTAIYVYVLIVTIDSDINRHNNALGPRKNKIMINTQQYTVGKRARHETRVGKNYCIVLLLSTSCCGRQKIYVHGTSLRLGKLVTAPPQHTKQNAHREHRARVGVPCCLGKGARLEQCLYSVPPTSPPLTPFLTHEHI